MALEDYCTSSFRLDTYHHETSIPTSKPTKRQRKSKKQQKSQSGTVPVPPSPASVVDSTPVNVSANELAPPIAIPHTVINGNHYPVAVQPASRMDSISTDTVREADLSLDDKALKAAEPDVENAGSWVAAAPIPRVQVIEKRKRTLSDLNGPEEALKKARHDEGLEVKEKEKDILETEGRSPPSPSKLEDFAGSNNDGLVDPETRAYMDNILAQIPASAAAAQLDELSSATKENWFDQSYARLIPGMDSTCLLKAPRLLWGRRPSRKCSYQASGVSLGRMMTNWPRATEPHSSIEGRSALAADL
ncbi:hypothetical protein BDZ89DRAFT_1083220 [Hymenopellis radicata]|nr:hypothetical protein BDZ89DRAFT_1083220 [Hymenopellis radicata]